MHSMGLFSVVPASVLLAISFFVLIAVRKVETAGLKKFGFAVALLLWISAAGVLAAGIAGHCRMSCMRSGRTGGHEKQFKYGKERGSRTGKYEVGKGTCNYEAMKCRSTDKRSDKYKKGN